MPVEIPVAALTASIELRVEFIERFLDTYAAKHSYGDLTEKSLPELVEVFDMELQDAKAQWPTIDLDAEWSEMDSWLSDRGIPTW
jgi:hypothetical protein